MADVTTGLAVVCAGLIVATSVNQTGVWAARVVQAAGAFLAVVCTGYIIHSWHNPFAYTGLVLGIWTVSLGLGKLREGQRATS